MGQWRDGRAAEVPLLGFEGEHYASKYMRSLLVPTLKGMVQVYAWSGPTEGYNVFFPEKVVPRDNATVGASFALSCKDAFEVKMIVQAYLSTVHDDLITEAHNMSEEND